MKLVTYSVVLNQHQAPVADALWELTNHQFTFIELVNLDDAKGGTEDYSKCPYLIRAWESPENYSRAMELARTAGCCIFSSIESLPFEKERMNLGLLSFDMSERWLKQGLKSWASPRLWKWLVAYYTGGWNQKPLYKLCMSAFAADDHYKMGTFKGKTYKWGYFTKVEDNKNSLSEKHSLPCDTVKIMWCARFIEWKHPELAVECAKRLRIDGYKFQLDMYGDGPLREGLELSVKSLELNEVVKFHGNIPNNQIHSAMRESDIFLFTSNRLEGWGAVANEAMSEGCCLVAGNEIGSAPYLITNGCTGLLFRSCDIDSLYEKVKYLLDNPSDRKRLADSGQLSLREVWSPKNAAHNLLKLIDDLTNNKNASILFGPCSKA